MQYMTAGDRIIMLRKFRGMTQKELGIAICLSEKGADIRITQYENGYRFPKPELLNEIACVLRVDSNNFHIRNSGSLVCRCLVSAYFSHPFFLITPYFRQ